MTNNVYDDQDTDTLKGLEESFRGADATESGSQKLAETKALEDAYNAPSASDSGSQKLADADQLRDQEDEAADDTVGNGYRSSNKKVRVSKGWWNRKRAQTAGGIAGVLGIGGIFGLSFLSGPLEFVHLASILHDAHFSQQEDAGDNRMGKLYRYLKSGGNAGETRIGWLGSKYHAKIIADLGGIGIVPEYGSLNTYKGFTLDTEHENSPYKGMTPEEAAAAFEEKTGVKPTIKGGKLTVDADSFWAQRKSMRAALGELNNSGLSTAIRARVLGKYGLVTFHPLKIVDKKIATKATDVAKAYKEKWDKRFKTGQDPVTVDGSKAQDESSDGKSTTTASDSDKTTLGEGSSDVSSKLKGIKTTGKVAGGLAAAAGLACALKAVDDSIGTIKYAQVIAPAIRVGLDAIAVGDQIKTGQDVDPAELSYLSRYFSSTDKTTGTTTSWTDAKTILADGGEDQTNGIDISQGIKDSIAQQKPSWLGWTQTGATKAMCSTAGQVVTTGVSVVVGIMSGDVLSQVIGFATSAVASGPIINFVSGLLAGDALNIDTLAGAAYGNVADYGAAMGANAASIAMGGVQLTAAQVSELNTQTQQEQKEQFDSQGFFARTFNVYDYHSLASILIDNQSSSFTQNLATDSTSVLNTFGKAFSMPARLFTSTTHAASTSYHYPFTLYGVSNADLNAMPEDPYQNAEYVAKNLLDNNGKAGIPDYIGKADQCFGVTISKSNADNVWDVTYDTSKYPDGINVYDTDNYNAKDCQDTSDVNWLKVRAFILDTGVMEGYACAKFQDSDSCQNDGQAVSSDTTTITTPATTSANGTIVVGEYNILNAPSYAHNGIKQANPSDDTRAKLEAQIIQGTVGPKHAAFDVLMTNEETNSMYTAQQKYMTPTYDSVRRNEYAIFWNVSKFTKIDHGTSTQWTGGGDWVDAPWVKLQTIDGQTVTLTAVHYSSGRDGKYNYSDANITKAANYSLGWVQQMQQQNDEQGDSKSIVIFGGDLGDHKPIPAKIFNNSGLVNNSYYMANDKKARGTDVAPGGSDQIYITPRAGLTASDWHNPERTGIIMTASDHSPTWVTLHYGGSGQ